MLEEGRRGWGKEGGGLCGKEEEEWVGEGVGRGWGEEGKGLLGKEEEGEGVGEGEGKCGCGGGFSRGTCVLLQMCAAPESHLCVVCAGCEEWARRSSAQPQRVTWLDVSAGCGRCFLLCCS